MVAPSQRLRPAAGSGGTLISGGEGDRPPGPGPGPAAQLPAMGPVLPGWPIAPRPCRSTPASGALWFPLHHAIAWRHSPFGDSQPEGRVAALPQATQWEQGGAGLDPRCPQEGRLIGREGGGGDVREGGPWRVMSRAGA